jgi:hypothetical protein
VAAVSRIFRVGETVIEIPQSLRFTQTYSPFGNIHITRTMDGKALCQYSWTKLKTSLSGEGGVPSGLAHIPWRTPQELHCAAPQSLSSASNTFTLPRPFRTLDGAAPTAMAFVGGVWKNAPVTLSGQTASVTPINGARLYMVVYYPILTVSLSPPQEVYDRTQSWFSWRIEAEEVQA